VKVKSSLSRVKLISVKFPSFNAHLTFVGGEGTEQEYLDYVNSKFDEDINFTIKRMNEPTLAKLQARVKVLEDCSATSLTFVEYKSCVG